MPSLWVAASINFNVADVRREICDSLQYASALNIEGDNVSHVKHLERISVDCNCMQPFNSTAHTACKLGCGCCGSCPDGISAQVACACAVCNCCICVSVQLAGKGPSFPGNGISFPSGLKTWRGYGGVFPRLHRSRYHSHTKSARFSERWPSPHLLLNGQTDCSAGIIYIYLHMCMQLKWSNHVQR